MKTSIVIFVVLAFLMGLVSCESMGLGPKQVSQASFELVDSDGDAYYPGNLSFTLPQFRTSTAYQGYGAPVNQSSDSAWVGRIVELNSSPMAEVENLQTLNYRIHFYQKEATDLLVLNDDCKCLDYPDAASFAEHFFNDAKPLSERQSIIASFLYPFAQNFTVSESSQVSIKASKNSKDTLYIKADFEFEFRDFRMQNGDFELEIPY
ncbi:MAG: hypothetical protein AB8H47_12970 [Bacteroidia bacterium]